MYLGYCSEPTSLHSFIRKRVNVLEGIKTEGSDQFNREIERKRKEIDLESVKE